MADDADSDIAAHTLDRVLDSMKLVGVQDEAVAPALAARAIFLWRRAGHTDDEILREVTSALDVPLGRNPR